MCMVVSVSFWFKPLEWFMDILHMLERFFRKHRGMQNVTQMQLLQLKTEHVTVYVCTYILSIFLIISFAFQNCFFLPSIHN